MARDTGDQAGAGGIQSVTLALNILEFLAYAGGSVGVSALAKELDTTKSRIYRHLQTLVSQGFIEQHPDSERYAIGPRIITLGQRVRDNLNLTVAGLPIIKELRDGVGQQCVLSGLQGGQLRILASVQSTGMVEPGFREGTVLPPHATAQGKVAMAFCREYREKALNNGLESFTDHTITKTPRLIEEMERIRGRGWADAPNEIISGVNGVAAPIFDSSEDLVGTVGISNFLQYLPQDLPETVTQQLCDAALRISMALGYRLGMSATR